MKHGRQLNSKFAARMDADSTLEFFAYHSGLPRLAQTAPESGIQQNYIDRVGTNTSRELLKIHDDGVGSSRHLDERTDAPHAFQTPAGVFKVVIPYMLDRTSDPNGFLYAPRPVGVQAKGIIGKFSSQRQIDIHIVIWSEDASLDFMRTKSMLSFEFSRGRHHLNRSLFSTATGLRIRIAIEEIARKWNLLANGSSQQIAGANA